MYRDIERPRSDDSFTSGDSSVTNGNGAGHREGDSGQLDDSYRRGRRPRRQGVDITHDKPGRIRIQCDVLFEDPSSELVQDFIERAFLAEETHRVQVDSENAEAWVHYTPDPYANGQHAKQILRKLSACFNGQGSRRATEFKRPVRLIPCDRRRVAVHRHGEGLLSTWEIRHETVGRMRFYHPALERKGDMCNAIERELMGILGIDNFKANAAKGTLVIFYDPRKIDREQIIEILDNALAATDHQPVKDPLDLDLPVALGSFALAGFAQYMIPALLPFAGIIFFISVLPTFKQAWEVLTKEKRMGVDVLDAIVIIACLSTGQIFAGTVLALCLAFGRKLLKKTQDDSKKMLLNVFGKQPRFVWVLRDGVEVETPLDKLEAGDTVVVHTGETVPVDGIISEGMAMIDQHTLTGESAPAEKVVGDKVLASTVMVAGKIHVAVEKSGGETTSSKLAAILNETSAYKLRSQSRGEEPADQAVLPTLAVGGLGYVVGGPAAATAILNCDFGTGIRMAAPLGMLASLSVAAHRGILIKDGRAMELLDKIDTVLFDKTGTLTREVPEVGRIFTYHGYDAETIISWAAAAERKFSHPIAKAIIEKFNTYEREYPTVDDSAYQVGYGITVQIEGHRVSVGSARFMGMEGMDLPEEIIREQEVVHEDGNSMIFVGVDGQLCGAIELVAAVRPEAEEIIAGLRERGIKHIVIISGDHDRPTRRLAEKLGMDRYFAEVLPQDKAKYVEVLQSEGKTVAFVGDGVNDSIALKKANVSISLRGASSIATDTAQIVFMEESLRKLCELLDIAHAMRANINRSWTIIIIPNVLCIAGAFTLGFGIMASMIANNVASVFALLNGIMPLRRVALEQAERALELEMVAEMSRRDLEAEDAVIDENAAPALPTPLDAAA